MHGPNARQQCRAVFHESYVFRVRAPFKSGGGPPHSKTLARRPRSPELPPGFGVRRPCGALDYPGRFKVPMHAKKRMRAFHEPYNALLPNEQITNLGFMVPMHAGKAERGLSMNRTNSACALLRKRRRAAALQDAGALAKVTRTSARFWSAPPLRRFGISREVHGANACGKANQGFP